NNEDFKINLYTGASMGPAADQSMAEAGIINLRMPYQGNAVQRKMINNGVISYIDQHLSHTAEQIIQGVRGIIDYAVIEEGAITELSLIIQKLSEAKSSIYVQEGDNFIKEINLTSTKEYKSFHDIYIPKEQVEDSAVIPVHNLQDLIGNICNKVHPN